MNAAAVGRWEGRGLWRTVVEALGVRHRGAPPRRATVLLRAARRPLVVPRRRRHVQPRGHPSIHPGPAAVGRRGEADVGEGGQGEGVGLALQGDVVAVLQVEQPVCAPRPSLSVAGMAALPGAERRE